MLLDPSQNVDFFILATIVGRDGIEELLGSSSFLTDDQLHIKDILMAHLGTQSPKKHPIVWIQGDAGCGKDFVVEQVLMDLGKAHLRVKGSNLQDVLLLTEQAKKEGKLLIIEKADLLCPNVLESLLDPMTYPHFSVIATVNGIEYSGRQPVSHGIMEKAVVVQCRPVSLKDIRGLLKEKFSKDLSGSDIELIVEWYRQLRIPLSPREIYSIVSEHLDSTDSLLECWERRISTLQTFRPSVQVYRDSLKEESEWLKEVVSHHKSRTVIKRSQTFVSDVCSRSGVGIACNSR